jgi:hypothetical protein
MARYWPAPILITDIYGRAHYPASEPVRVGPVQTVCGQLITPAPLIAPVGDTCPDCAPPELAAATSDRQPRRRIRMPAPFRPRKQPSRTAPTP